MSTPTDPFQSPSATSGGPVPSVALAPDPIVKERPFVIGLLLTVVTLGIYHLFWHYQTHDELARQMGVANHAKPVWIAYIAIAIVSFALSFVGPGAFETEPQTPDELFQFVADWGWLILLNLVLSIASATLWILYVVQQWRLVTLAKARTGLRLRSSLATFLWLTIGSIALLVFFFWLIVPLLAPLILIPLAYHRLQENYNDIPRALNAHHIDPAAYAPGGPGWQHGPARPAGSGAPSSAEDATAPGRAPTWSAHASGPEPYADASIDPVADQSHGAVPAHAPGPAGAPLVEQTFQCPRCHAHVTARGQADETVAVRCPQCGESGEVHLPRPHGSS